VGSCTAAERTLMAPVSGTVRRTVYVARHADRLVGEEESLMIEPLAGMSPSNAENLLEEPALAEAAIAGVRLAEPDPPAGLVVDAAEPSAEELAIARELVRSVRSRGVAMTGPGGMLKALTKTVIETALDSLALA
jgi:hypothetical protein